MRIVDLRTNHQKEPLGIDGRPEFSWRMESKKTDVLQLSYRLRVRNGETLLWDSGMIRSRKQAFLPYEGPALSPKTRYEWEVELGNDKGESASAVSHFETALLFPSEWKGTWIESTIPRNPNKLFTYGIENPAVLFRRKMILRSRPVRARLYATAYGVYKTLLNGKVPDDREFAPEFTPYAKILNYQVYDVSALLSRGENVLTFLVGDGWFFCEQTAIATDPSPAAPAILYQLEAEYENGDREIWVSDGSETCETGAIVFSDLFMGERRDDTLPKGTPLPVALKAYGFSRLRAQPMPPVRAVELFPAQRIFTSPKGETIVDFGQVLSGRARIRIDEPHGNEVVFEYTEVLDKDQNYFSTMTAKQKDVFVSGGVPTDYEAQFTFHGFRYLRVTGMTNPEPKDFTAVLLSTEKANAATFSCSDERFNRLYKNIRYSQKNNMMSIPTDCPSREKAGWTGDILVYAKTALQNEDMTPFLTSWLDGLMADQQEDGVIPIISPYTKLYQSEAMKRMMGVGGDKATGVSGWSDAMVWVPWTMHQVTGNGLILSRCYESMKKWCDWIIRTAKEKRGSDLPPEIDQYLWNTGFHFGEWLVPGRTGVGFDICKETAFYTAPFFGYRTLRLMSEIATLQEKTEDAVYYGDIAERMKTAIQTGLFDNDSMPCHLMGGYVLAFAFDLVPERWQTEFKNRLVRLVEENGEHLGTGFLATPFLLDTLDKIGRPDLAKGVLWQTEAPSWLYEVEHGATAIWESWISYEPDGNPLRTSFDHYAFGCIDDWIARNVAGIEALDAGYSRILIHPRTDMGFDSCERTFLCEAGEISVSWTKDELKVKIPCNTTAKVVWKGKETEIGSGKHVF